MQGEVLLLHRKRQCKSLLMSWRVQRQRRMSTGLQGKWQNCVKDANGKVLIENDQVKEE